MNAAGASWAAGAANVCPVGGSAGALFAQLFTTLIHAQCLLGDRSIYPPDTEHPLPEYDFIVVGAGSAGAAVAARLSENPEWKVLLLEAGGDPPPASDIPRIYRTLLRTEVDWSYLTEPDGRACLAKKDGRCAWGRGKMLGGTSSINGMMHVRGSPQDYDGWAALGNDGWSYQDVLPFFKKLETFDEQELKARPHTVAVHGRNGPIQVTSLGRPGPNWDTLDAAVKELGFKVIEDYSAEPNIGFGPVHVTIKNGTRWHTARAYLGPAKERQNLHVVKFAYVTKVLVDSKTLTAYGVQYLKGGITHKVRARKEVILSAGAINTPHILMHSGIGPKDHLEAVGVPVIRDLKVGYNLQDHAMYDGLFYTRKAATRNVLPEAVFEYLTNRTGYLSSLGDATYTGFIQTEKGPRGAQGFPKVDATNYPDIQFIFFMLESANPEVVTHYGHVLNYKEEATDTLKEIIKNHDAMYVMTSVLAPTSRGRIKLRSADPTELPLIETGYYTDPRDLDNMVAGVEFAHRMGSTKAMQDAGFSVKDYPLEACRNRPPLSPEYWRCSVPYLTATLYHPTSTAKMGPSSDADAVVDPHLRVYGVRNLRVADASIMPLIVRANTNAASIMIGEKCAHMVAEDWQRKNTETSVKTEL